MHSDSTKPPLWQVMHAQRANREQSNWREEMATTHVAVPSLRSERAAEGGGPDAPPALSVPEQEAGAELATGDELDDAMVGTKAVATEAAAAGTTVAEAAEAEGAAVEAAVETSVADSVAVAIPAVGKADVETDVETVEAVEDSAAKTPKFGEAAVESAVDEAEMKPPAPK